MGKKLVLIVIAILLLAAAGGSYYLFFMNKTSQSQPSDSEDIMMDESGDQVPLGGVKSLSELLKLNVAQTCTYKNTQDGSEGSVYVSGGKVRVSFVSEMDGKVTDSNVIVKDSKTYIWNEGETQGYVFAAEESSMNDSNTPKEESENEPQNFNMDDQVDYKCSVWVGDDSMFELPVNVDFKDMSKMVEDAMQESKDNMGIDCSACDSVPEEAKAQCLTSLGCN